MTNHASEVVQVLERLLVEAREGKITGITGIAHYGHDLTAKFGVGSCPADIERTMQDLQALEAQYRQEEERLKREARG